MSRDEQQAIAWAVKLLDGFFALTGMDPKPENRARFETLRSLAKGVRG